MGQDIFDLVIILTLVFFTLRGARVGLVGEVAGVVSLLGGFWGARAFHGLVSPHLTFISGEGWRTFAAWGLVFAGIMLAVGLIARLVKKLVAFSFASWADKLAGGVFGLAKGVLIWALVLIVAEKLFQNDAFMRDSRVMPYFHALVGQLREWLPQDIATKLGL